MELLERDSFLETLTLYLTEADAGMGRTVLVCGEAGIGKTTLVEAFVHGQRDSSRVLLRGACDGLFTRRALGPLMDIAPDVGPELGDLLKDGTRDEIFRAFLAQLGANDRTTIVIIEDVHWADEATLDMLRYLGRRLGATRTLLIVTYRDDEIGETHPLRVVIGDLSILGPVRRIRLPPLSKQAVVHLVGNRAIEIDPLFRQTGGNPFFVTEVLASGELGVPETVRDVVLARASRLSRSARHTLDAAALIGPRIEEQVLFEVADVGPDAVDECIGGGLLHSHEDGLAFRHELARLAVEGAMSSSRRRTLQRRILKVLETSPHSKDDFARLAHHAEAGADSSAVLRLAPVAARRAAELGAHREAAALYAVAIRHAESLPTEERAALLEARSYECYLTDQLHEAVEARRTALGYWKSVGNILKEGDSHRWLSRLLWFLTRRQEADAAAQSAIELLEQVRPGRELAMAYSNKAHLLMLAGDAEGTRVWGGRAIDLAEKLQEPEIVSHALNNVGASQWQRENEAGRQKLERSLDVAIQHSFEEHVARALTNLSSISVSIRRYEIAERYFAEGFDYCTERDLDSWRLYMLGWQARMLFEQGRWDDALIVSDTIRRFSRVAPVSLINAFLIEGRIATRRGDASAEGLLAEALKLATGATELQRLAPVASARAELAWLGGDVERTVREVRDVFELAMGRGSAWEVGEPAYWMWRGGAIEKAPAGAAVPFSLEIAGDFETAARAWTDIGCPYEAAIALTHGTETDLRSALNVLQELGARPAIALVAKKLRAMGAGHIPRGPRATTSTHPAGLTPRESEVLQLMAEGLRNADIGKRLFISTKTVDHHVSAILRKLGVDSRSDALDEARRLNILQHGGHPTPT